MNAIEMRGVCRAFGDAPAVVGLDLVVPEGSVFGLLGENGSGKTTTIKMIMAALVPHAGEIRVLGHDPLTMPLPVRARIGFVWDEMEAPALMPLREAMAIHASYFPKWDTTFAKRLMDQFELAATMRFGKLSKGQKRRFLLLLAAAQQPDLLVLDEPASGLDVSIRRQYLDLLLELSNERNMTVLISSHILSDVERIVDHAAFIKAGRLIRQAELEEMKSRVKRICLRKAQDEGEIQQRFNVLALKREQDGALIVVEDFAPGKLDGIDCTVEHLNLEELFLVYNETARGRRNG